MSSFLLHNTLISLDFNGSAYLSQQDGSVFIAEACVTLSSTFVLSTLIIIGTEQSLKYLGNRLMSHSNKKN